MWQGVVGEVSLYRCHQEDQVSTFNTLFPLSLTPQFIDNGNMIPAAQILVDLASAAILHLSLHSIVEIIRIRIRYLILHLTPYTTPWFAESATSTDIQPLPATLNTHWHFLCRTMDRPITNND